MSTKGKPVECTNFEPQIFRKSLCKNCFRTKEQHGVPRPATPAIEGPQTTQAETKATSDSVSTSQAAKPLSANTDTTQDTPSKVSKDQDGVVAAQEVPNTDKGSSGRSWLKGGVGSRTKHGKGEEGGRAVTVVGQGHVGLTTLSRGSPKDQVRSLTPTPLTLNKHKPLPAAATSEKSAEKTSSNISQDKNTAPQQLPAVTVQEVSTGGKSPAGDRPGVQKGVRVRQRSQDTAVEAAGRGAGADRPTATQTADVGKADTSSSSSTAAAAGFEAEQLTATAAGAGGQKKQATLSIQLSPSSSASSSPLPSPTANLQPSTEIHSKVNSQAEESARPAAVHSTPEISANLKQQQKPDLSGKSGGVLLVSGAQGGGEALRYIHSQPAEPHHGHLDTTGTQSDSHPSIPTSASIGPSSHQRQRVREPIHTDSSRTTTSTTSDLSSPPCPPAKVQTSITLTSPTSHKSRANLEQGFSQQGSTTTAQPTPSLEILPSTPRDPHTGVQDAGTYSSSVVPSLDIHNSRYRDLANANAVSPGNYASTDIVHVKPTDGRATTPSSVQYQNQYNASQGQGLPSKPASQPQPKQQIQYHPPQATQTYTANSLFHHCPDTSASEEPSWGSHSSWNSPSRISAGGLVYQFEDDRDRQTRQRDIAKDKRRRRRLASLDEINIQDHRRKMADLSMGLSRDEALMEGTRMIMDNLRDKLHIAEQRCDQIEREKCALAELLNVKKAECNQLEMESQCHIGDLEDQVRRLVSEKSRLLEKLKLPESERSSLVETENEIAILIKKLDDTEFKMEKSRQENEELRQAIQDCHLEMDEMHDQFREDEAIEFREMQKDLEATAKNCRILQFKLRKSERRNEQLEHDQLQYEDKIRQLESRFEAADDKQHIRELEEELRMAKEVSVRLHDELELVEERRARYEEELDRVNDILTESENRRQALQKELDQVHDQMAEMRSEQRAGGVKEKHLGIPGSKAPKLGSLSREGSSEVDVEQLMRDLSDSLERENDVKDQLKYAEEETHTMRKKMSDLEEENESLTLQLQKLSSAKSGKFFGKKKKDVDGDKEVVTEREHEMRMQMELAEQEVKVLRRKLDEMNVVHDTLRGEIRSIQALVGTSDDESSRPPRPVSPDDRPYEERIESMAKDIDQLKWKLIEKDRGGTSSKGQRTLQKSKSLEGDIDSPTTATKQDHQSDLRRQLDIVQQEAKLLRDKFVNLENENERLISENKKLQLLSSRRLPSITTDDSAMQNIELRDKVKQLESDNATLRDKVRTLDQKTSKMSKDFIKAQPHTETISESEKLHEYLAQIKMLEDENRTLRRKMADLEARNATLHRDLKKHKKDDQDKPTQEFSRSLEKSSRMELKDRIWELEGEIKDLLTVIRNREEENERLEEEIGVCNSDMDHMLEGFKEREKQLLEEVDMTQQKNNVLSNLLDLVTERAESTQRELEKYVRESSSKSGSVSVSATSEASIGSDEVFVLGQLSSEGKEGKDGKVVQKDWEVGAKQDQLLKRIESLERLLAEERRKSDSGKKGDDPIEADLHLREREILQQELELCQRQLREANERVKELKTRQEQLEESRGDLKDDYDKVSKELEEARGKKDVQGKGALSKTKPDKEPASWRWEKQRMEEEIKEYKKKMEDNQAKWKTAGEDREKDTKLREKLQEEVKELTEKLQTENKELAKVKAKLEEVQETLKKKEKQWEKERTVLGNEIKAAEKETKLKEEVISSKDDIIKQKDDLVKQKDQALKEKDDEFKSKDADLKKKCDEVDKKSNDIKNLEKQLEDLRRIHAQCSIHISEKEKQVKSLGEDLRLRDERLKEKDDILEQLNRKLVDKQNEVSDMDKTIRTTMKKLQDRENEIKTVKSEKNKTEKDITDLRSKVKDLEKSLEAAKKELRTELASVAVKKEKVESELSTVTKEKKSLLSDLQDAKEKLKKKEDKWKKEKNNLDLELKKANEKLSSMEATKGMKHSEAMKKVTEEKDKLMSENHKLTEDLSKLKKEKKCNKKEWQEERDDLQKIISEKTKLVEDNSAICERMQKEIDSLKAQVQSTSKSVTPAPAGKKLTPIPVQHETTKKTPIPVTHHTSTPSSPEVDADLAVKLQNQELIHQAESEGLRTKYEGQISVLEDRLSHAQTESYSIKKDYEKQKGLLQSCRQSVTDVKARYDQSLSSWNEEKKLLETKAAKAEESKSKLDKLEKEMEDLRSKLKQEEAKRQEATNKLASEKSSWNADKLALQKQIKKLEDQPTSPTKGPAKVTEFRARFEKFEKGPEKKTGSTTSKSSNGSTTLERDKVIDEAQKLAKNLQKQIDEQQKTHEKERKELLEKVEQAKKEGEKEKKDLRDRASKLEQKTSSFTNVEKSLVDLRQQMEQERSKWEQEREQLRKEMDEAKKEHLQDKEKLNDVLSEVKKLQVVAPTLENLDKPSTKKDDAASVKKGRKSEEKEVTKVKVIPFGAPKENGKKEEKDDGSKALEKPAKFFLQALEHISRLAGEVSRRRASPGSSSTQVQPAPRRPLKSSRVPPLFRRSLSTSEVEIPPEKETSVYVGRPAPQEELLQPVYSGSVAQAAPSPTLLPDTRPSRSREIKRAQSTIVEGEGDPFAEVDRRPKRVGGGNGSNRASFYASGTQSATVSRETSPERLLANLKKPLRLPAAPPSMIISPSHTPRRAPSVERGQGDFSSRDMQRLYQKLSAIEKETEHPEPSQDPKKALLKERGGGLRVLTKSMSVDCTNLETPSPQPPSSTSRDYSPMYTSQGAIPTAYDDAPQSETLPASIRFGALVITPGVEKLTSAYRQKRRDEKRSASVSPRSARKQFYEDYERKAAWQTHRRRDVADSDTSDAESFYETKSLGRPKKSPKSPKSSKSSKSKSKGKEQEKDIDSDVEGKKESKTFKLTPASFFESIREKRRLFGSKRAQSVDNSAVRMQVANIGVNVLPRPGAPSTYEPPEVEAKEPKKKGLHKRAGSIDASTLHSTATTESKAKPSKSSSTSSGSKTHSSEGTTSVSAAKSAASSSEPRTRLYSESDSEEDIEEQSSIPAVKTVRFNTPVQAAAIKDGTSSIGRNKSMKKASLRPISMDIEKKCPTMDTDRKRATKSRISDIVKKHEKRQEKKQEKKQSVEDVKKDFSETCV